MHKVVISVALGVSLSLSKASANSAVKRVFETVSYSYWALSEPL